MTKKELSNLLHNICCDVATGTPAKPIPVNEGITDLDNRTTFPRIDFWEIAWEDIMGSGDSYHDKVSYQISFYARVPRHASLLQLRQALRDVGEHPVIYHEFIAKDRVWHSYMKIEVIEDGKP